MDVIEGRWKVKGELDYSGPTPTPAENLAEAKRRLGRLVLWALTSAIVAAVSSCAHFIAAATIPRGGI